MPADAVDINEATGVADDHELIRFSWTDPERFAEIFDRHAEAIHRYLARRIGRSVADDLAAETFLVAFRGREGYDVSQTDARPWLYGIAANLLRREQRTEVRQYRALARTGVDPVLGRVSKSVTATR
ncbi:RNA polymerase sigma factor, partial [Plantactinospora endophytica]|uniref:RNA polymerase sigma factor n=2 Tax=Plantactinospora endophytica TaxID=673535 RepID=UPI00363BE4FD